MTTEVDDFLIHYGVKGMRWGRRKDRSEEERATYPKLTKKQAVIGASVLVGVALVAVAIANQGDIKATINGVPFGYERSHKETIDQLLKRNADNRDVTLPAGQVFSRISTVAESTVKSTTYVSYKTKDNLAYKSTYGSGGKYQVDIEAVAPIKFPSRKNKVSTLSEMIDTPLSSPDYGGRTLRQVLADKERSSKGKQYVNTVSAKRLATYVNDNLDVDDFRKGYGSEFLDKLKSKGYSAISDPIDGTAYGQNRKSASILIDDTLFKVANAKRITPEDLVQAKSDLKTLLNS